MDGAATGAPDWPAVLRDQWSTAGAPWAASSARSQMRRVAALGGVRRRFAPTSYVTLTPSRWLGKACRSTSFNVSLGTRISGSRRSTSKALTAPRSSRQFADLRHACRNVSLPRPAGEPAPSVAAGQLIRRNADHQATPSILHPVGELAARYGLELRPESIFGLCEEHGLDHPMLHMGVGP